MSIGLPKFFLLLLKFGNIKTKPYLKRSSTYREPYIWRRQLLRAWPTSGKVTKNRTHPRYKWEGNWMMVKKKKDRSKWIHACRCPYSYYSYCSCPNFFCRADRAAAALSLAAFALSSAFLAAAATFISYLSASSKGS